MITLFLFMICSSCYHHVEEKRFLFEEELTGVFFPIHETFSPSDMYICNNYLILHQGSTGSNMPDIFFQVYTLTDYTYLGSFGQRGRGPGEWLLPDIIYSQSPYLYLWDVSSRRSTAAIYKIQLDSMAHPTTIDTFWVEKGYNTMNHPVIRKDSLLVFDEFIPEAAIRVYHLKEDLPVLTMEYGAGSSLENRSTDENRGLLYANDSCLVFLYVLKDQIDILDWNLKLKKRRSFQKSTPVIYQHEDVIDNVRYYDYSFLGEHFLYTFYYGMSPKEMLEKNYRGHTLDVFDLEGTPIYRYTFSGFEPLTFVVDEPTFTLYGYRGHDGLEDSISVYHLSGLKEYLQNR